MGVERADLKYYQDLNGEGRVLCDFGHAFLEKHGGLALRFAIF